MSKFILKKTSTFYIAVSIHNFTRNIFNFICEKVKVQFSRSSKSFGEDLEDPRSDKIYSSGNRGVKKGPGPRGSRDEEFLVPSLILTISRPLKILQQTEKGQGTTGL